MNEATRHKTFGLRVTPTEHDLLHRAADVAGEDGSTWARTILLNAARQTLQRYLDKVSQEPSASERQTEPEKAVVYD